MSTFLKHLILLTLLALLAACGGKPQPEPEPVVVEAEAADFLGGEADAKKLSFDGDHGALVWSMEKGGEKTTFDAKTGEIVEMSW